LKTSPHTVSNTTHALTVFLDIQRNEISIHLLRASLVASRG
jgi:hypothetical protein